MEMASGLQRTYIRSAVKGFGDERILDMDFSKRTQTNMFTIVQDLPRIAFVVFAFDSPLHRECTFQMQINT